MPVFVSGLFDLILTQNEFDLLHFSVKYQRSPYIFDSGLLKSESDRSEKAALYNDIFKVQPGSVKALTLL